MSKDDQNDEDEINNLLMKHVNKEIDEEKDSKADKETDEEKDSKADKESEDENTMEEPTVEERAAKKKRTVVRRGQKKKVKKDDGELEPFDLKSFFIPEDRNWVLPAFIAFVVLLFGYYMIVFMGVVAETCDGQAEIGDDDCDGYVDNPGTGSDDSGDSGDSGSDSSNNSTSGDSGVDDSGGS
jgi:hypothetical protein